MPPECGKNAESRSKKVVADRHTDLSAAALNMFYMI